MRISELRLKATETIDAILMLSAVYDPEDWRKISAIAGAIHQNGGRQVAIDSGEGDDEVLVIWSGSIEQVAADFVNIFRLVIGWE